MGSGGSTLHVAECELFSGGGEAQNCVPGSAYKSCLSKHHHDKTKCRGVPRGASRGDEAFRDFSNQTGIANPLNLTGDIEEALAIGGVVLVTVLVLPPLLRNV